MCVPTRSPRVPLVYVGRPSQTLRAITQTPCTTTRARWRPRPRPRPRPPVPPPVALAPAAATPASALRVLSRCVCGCLLVCCLFACLFVWLCTASAALLAGRQYHIPVPARSGMRRKRRGRSGQGYSVLQCGCATALGPRVGGPLLYYRQRVQFNVEHIAIQQEYDDCKAMQFNAMQRKAVRCDTLRCTQLRTNRNIR